MLARATAQEVNSQVAKDLCTTRADGQVGDATEASAESEGHVRRAAAVAAKEDSGCLSIGSKTVERTRSNVQVRVRGRQSENEQAGVDDGRQHLDLCNVDGNDERRGRCSCLALGSRDETRVIVRYDHAYYGGSNDVEEENAEECLRGEAA